MSKFDELADRLSTALSRIEDGVAKRDREAASNRKMLQKEANAERQKTKSLVIELEEAKVARRRDLADVEEILTQVKDLFEENGNG